MDAQASARIAKLDEVLRGVPYQYQNKQRLRNDVAQLLRNCATLQPALSTFQGGGRSVTLFYLSGVLPITYNRATYNIPVTVYFDPPYPSQAPRCFVTPTKDMAIKNGHQHVDAGGMIYVPYLTQWDGRGSSLPELVATLQSVFSQAPPVYSTAASAAPAAVVPAQATVPAAVASTAGAVATSAAGESQGFLSGLFGGRGRSSASQPQAGYPQVATAQPVAAVVTAQPIAAVVTAQPVVAQPQPSAKEKAVQTVTERARERWPQILKPLVDEANAQLDKRAELESHTAKVDAELEGLKVAAAQNARDEAELKAIEVELRAFMEAYAGKELNPDSIRDSLDADAQLVLETLSEELALQEFLVALEKLRAGGKVSMVDYMQEVREVGRRQAVCRVMRQKATDALRAAAGEPLVVETPSVPTAVGQTPVAVAPAVAVQAPAAAVAGAAGPIPVAVPVAEVPRGAPVAVAATQDPNLLNAAATLEWRIADLEARIAKADQEARAWIAKQGTNPSAKARAMQVLKGKKVYEQQRDQLIATLFNVENLQFQQEQAEVTMTVVNAMKKATEQLKGKKDKINLEAVEKLIDDVQDIQDEMKEVQEALAKPAGATLDDEDEFEAEYERLLEEQQLQKLVGAGTSSTVPAAPVEEPATAASASSAPLPAAPVAVSAPVAVPVGAASAISAPAAVPAAVTAEADGADCGPVPAAPIAMTGVTVSSSAAPKLDVPSETPSAVDPASSGHRDVVAEMQSSAASGDRSEPAPQVEDQAVPAAASAAQAQRQRKLVPA